MSGSFATSDFLFAHIDKTGSMTVSEMIHILYDGRITPFTEYLGLTKPEGYSTFPVISTIRNPFTYYVSYWEYFKPKNAAIDLISFSTFEDWVRACPDAYVKKYIDFVPDDAHVIKMENQTEDFIRIMENIRGPYHPYTLKFIRTFERRNVNLDRKRSYADYYDEELLNLILNNNGLIFDRFYPDRTFPEENL